MEEFQTALAQSLHRCAVCLEAVHNLVAGPVQVECLDEEQWAGEQWAGEYLVEGFQTALVQSSHRCEVCLEVAHSLVAGLV